MKNMTYCSNTDCQRFIICERGNWLGKDTRKISFAGFNCEKYDWDGFRLITSNEEKVLLVKSTMDKIASEKGVYSSSITYEEVSKVLEESVSNLINKIEEGI